MIVQRLSQDELDDAECDDCGQPILRAGALVMDFGIGEDPSVMLCLDCMMHLMMELVKVAR